MAIFILLVVLVFRSLHTPHTFQGLPNESLPQSPQTKPTVLSDTLEAHELSPLELSLRFFHPAAIPAPPAPPPAPRPIVSASWLSYLGEIGIDDSTKYMFKDSRSNHVVTLSTGERKEGWQLEAVSATEFIVDVEGSRYRVAFSH